MAFPVQAKDVRHAFQQAIAVTSIRGTRKKTNRREYSFWPSVIHISSLAYAVTKADKDSVLCALGIGLQIPRTVTPAMQLGTNIHNSLLPVVAEILGGKHEVPVGVTIEDVQLVGSADLVVNETVIEVKTGREVAVDEYAKLQASLYAHLLGCLRQMLVTINSVDFSVAVIEIEKSSRLNEAMDAIRRYAQTRHLQPVGKCETCNLFDLCNAYPANRRTE